MVYLLNRNGSDWKLKPGSAYNSRSGPIENIVFDIGVEKRFEARRVFDPLMRVRFGQVPLYTPEQADFIANAYIIHRIAAELDAILEVFIF